MYLLCALFTMSLAFNNRRSRATQAIDWCDYWVVQGIERAECSFRAREVLPPSTSPVPPQPVLPSICTKRFFFSSCQQDSRCASNLLCLDVDSISCCQPPHGVCPTSVQLGFSCVVKSPQSWCHRDSDCGRRGKCCPTGCDYNICV